jgi:hypothetical protein
MPSQRDFLGSIVSRKSKASKRVVKGGLGHGLAAAGLGLRVTQTLRCTSVIFVHIWPLPYCLFVHKMPCPAMHWWECFTGLHFTRFLHAKWELKWHFMIRVHPHLVGTHLILVPFDFLLLLILVHININKK